MKTQHVIPLAAAFLGLTGALLYSLPEGQVRAHRDYCEVYECGPCTPGVDCPEETSWMCCPSGHPGGPCPALGPDECDDVLYWCDNGSSVVLPDGGAGVDCVDPDTP